jgi:Cu-processing system permease protein
MLGRIWAIALNTFREAARIRVLYGVVVLVVAANLLALVLGEMSIREQDRVARDVGLAGISLFGSLTAIFLGVFLLYTEIQRRTIHAIVSKPLERWEFVVGKYGGMALVLSTLVALFALSMTGLLAWYGIAITVSVVKAIALAWMEVLVVAAVAIFFSSFSTPFLSGIFALGVWVIGRVTPDLRAVAAKATSPLVETLTGGVAEAIPDIHLFSVSGRSIDGQTVSVHGDFVSWGYVAMAGGHAVLWIAGLLIIACVVFSRRDFV